MFDPSVATEVHMIRGFGVDIVEVDRLARSMGRTASFAERVFVADEIEYCRAMADPAPHFAVRFAAKEAVMKALGTGWGQGVSFRDIAVRRPEHGPPEVELTGGAATRLAALGGSRVWLSLSHERSCAVATALIEGEADEGTT